MTPWDGLLLVDKPAGPTSHDVVAVLRRVTGARRVGHAGTLDPAATGLLPMVFGRATRLVRFLPSAPKEYVGTLRLGLATDTDDLTGAVVHRHDGSLPDPRAVEQAAARLLGRSFQIPPRYSARQVGGQRLHRLARRGVVVEAPAAEVEIQTFDLAPLAQPGHYRFITVVSSGTYVRALARDLGLNLGCGGTLETLRRTRIGPFDVDGPAVVVLDTWPAIAAERLASALLPLDQVPLEPPPLRLGAADSARVRCGLEVQVSAGLPCGPCRLIGPGDELLGIGEIAAGSVRPRVVLPPAS